MWRQQLPLALLAGTLGILACGAAQPRGPAVLEDFEQTLGPEWAFHNGPEFPGATASFERSAEAAHDGDAGGRLAFDFTGGGAYVQAMVELPAEPALEAVELWIRKPVTNRMTFRCVDEAQQTFQKSLNFARTDWQRVRVRLDRWTFSWGGPGDGQFRGRPTAFGILVEQGPAATGAVDLDGLVGIVRQEGTIVEGRDVQYEVTRFRPEEGWGFWAEGPGGQTAREGDLVRYDFSAGATRVSLGQDLSLLGEPQELRLTLDSDGGRHEVRLAVYSHFQHFERSLGLLTEKGPVTLTAPLGDLKTWEHYGGEDDGIARLPLRIGRLSIVRREGGADRGEVRLGGLTVRTAVPPAERLFPLARLTHDEAGLPTFELSVQSLAAETPEATVTTRLRDFGGRVLEEREAELTLEPGGAPGQLWVPVPPGDRPFVEAQFAVSAPGQQTQTASATFVAPGSDAGSPELRPASPWGMGLYLYRYPGDAAGLATMDRAAALAQAAGVKWSREEFLWHRIEPEKGRFDWAYYDQVVETAQRHGISIYGLIDYWSEWTQSYTEEGIEDYCRYVEALVTHYQDRIKHWEIWNEPNIFFWSGPKELYPKLLDRAYETIKAVDPDAVVFGCSTAGIDSAFIQRTMDAGARFDGLTIHPYRGELNDAGFVDELRKVADLVERRPVWITEMGWSTQLGGEAEREQGNLLARCYLASVASGAVQNVSWYDFREDGANPYYNEHHFGVIRHDLSLKPAYRAAATVCRTVGEATPVGFEEWSEGVYACRFAKEGGEVLAVWSTAGGCTLTFPAEDLTALNLMGEPVPLSRRDGAASLYLAPRSPVLLRSAQPGLRATVQPLTARLATPGLQPGEAGPIELALGAWGAAATEVSWQTPPGWAITPAGAGAFTLQVPPDAPLGMHEVLCVLRSGEEELLLPLTVSVEPEVLEV